MFCFSIFGAALGVVVDGVVVDGAVAVAGAGAPLAPGAAGPGLAEIAGDGVVVAGVVDDGVAVEGAAAVEGTAAPLFPGAGWPCLFKGASDVPGVVVCAGNGWPDDAPGNGWPSGAFGCPVGGVVWPGRVCGCAPVIGGVVPGGVWLWIATAFCWTDGGRAVPIKGAGVAAGAPACPAPGPPGA